MKYFDLHCDTLTTAFDKGEWLSDNTCDISLSLTGFFEKYTQVLAVWSDPERTRGEQYERFLEITSRLSETSLPDNFSYILAVEGATLLDGNLDRLHILYEKGVRIFTPLWKGVTELGGAFGEKCGLTELGKKAISLCLDVGIIPDVSHASDESFNDIYSICTARSAPFIASHSNSRALCDHARNLTDIQAKKVAESGGIIGVSAYPPHLHKSGKATVSDLLSHIQHYVMLCGENSVAIGLDLDGTDGLLPDEINRVNDIKKLYSLVTERFSRKTADRIFFENANDFFETNGILPKK